MSLFNDLLPVIGGIAGFAVGGPAGAAVGAGLGVAIGGDLNAQSTQSGIAGQAQYQSGVVFGEQQGFERTLQNLIADPSSVTKTPGYAFNLAQGEQAVTRAFGPTTGSGAEGVALTQYGEGYAMNTYNQQVQMLSNLAGITSPVNPTAALNTASGAASASNTSLQQLLATLTFAGGASGGSGSSGSNWLSNLLGGGGSANSASNFAGAFTGD